MDPYPSIWITSLLSCSISYCRIVFLTFPPSIKWNFTGRNLFVCQNNSKTVFITWLYISISWSALLCSGWFCFDFFKVCLFNRRTPFYMLFIDSIISRLTFPFPISQVNCVDSYSIYDYFLKLLNLFSCFCFFQQLHDSFWCHFFWCNSKFDITIIWFCAQTNWKVL